MTKVDFKKSLKHLYRPGAKEFVIVDVPTMQFVMVDGVGAPGGEAYANSVQWLYSVSFPLKFISKKATGKDYVVPPLEGLWWADDMNSFVDDERDKWKWTSLMMVPDWVTHDMFEEAVEKAKKKLGDTPSTLRFEKFNEGKSVQIMHIGPFSEEGPTIARLHNEFLPQNGLVENGYHHEIYLGDPRKTAPEKLRTVLRQPVKGK